MGEKIFICYSRRDSRWRDDLLKMLSPPMRSGMVDIWWDEKIEPGQHWKNEIDTALVKTKMGLLLVSPNFFASDFITNHELPYLLKAAEDRKLKITWVLLDYCLYENTQIGKYQAVYPTEKPLRNLYGAKRSEALKQIAEILIKNFSKTNRNIDSCIPEIPIALVKEFKKTPPNIILCIGSGISCQIKRPSGNNFPSWVDLLKEMLDFSHNLGFTVTQEERESFCSLLNQNSPQSLIRVGSWLRRLIGECFFKEFIDETFRLPQDLCSPIYDILTRIPIKGIVTFNYDNIIEFFFGPN